MTQPTIEIGNTVVGSDTNPYIIAEAGVNFRSDLELGKAFVEEAAAGGASAVKFQTHVPSAEMVESEMRRIGFGDLYERMDSYSLSKSAQTELAEHCSKHDVAFLSTPFCVEAVDILEEVGLSTYKIGSGELTNYNLLDRVSQTGKPVLLSTGMHKMKEVSSAHDFLKEREVEHAFLYCISEYPTDPEQFNLGTIERMSDEFGVPIGFSDHSAGIKTAVIAMARGASVIEKHFTIDRRLPGGDQEVSIDPEELAQLSDYAELVHKTRPVFKGVSDDESSIAEWARHSLVTKQSIEAGQRFSQENMTTKRPGTGIPGTEFFQVIGKHAANDLGPDDVIGPDDLES